MSLMPAMTRFDEEVAAPAAAGPLRTYLVTGAEKNPEHMLRFVVGPEGEVVPDLARRLPGRGMWVKAERKAVEQAVARKLFSKAARASVKASPDLADRIERLLRDRALEDLGRARRAGRAVAGFVRVEQMIDQGRAGLLIVPEEADGDGLARLRTSGLPVERLADAAALGGIFGREHAVYVAVARDDRSGQFVQRIAGDAARWRRYRLNSAG